MASGLPDLSDREVSGAVHAAIFRGLILIIFSFKLLELARSASRRVTDQTNPRSSSLRRKLV
jgi:hypothetical protein